MSENGEAFADIRGKVLHLGQTVLVLPSIAVRYSKRVILRHGDVDYEGICLYGCKKVNVDYAEGVDVSY